MVRSDAYLQLADIAASQWGMVTTGQARLVNVNAQQIARLSAAGVLQRLQHGVYRLAGVPNDPLAELKAAWLGLDPKNPAADRLARPDPGGVVSHRSAARVHRVGDLEADVSEFSIATARRSRHPGIRLYKRALDPSDWQIIDGLPTTTVAATVRDLAAAATDGGHLAVVIRDALLHGQLSYADAVSTLRPYAHHYGAPLGDGRALLRHLLGEAGLHATITAADELGQDWLAEQLDKTGLRYRTAEVLHTTGQHLAAEAELLSYSDIFGPRTPQRPDPLPAAGSTALPE